MKSISVYLNKSVDNLNDEITNGPHQEDHEQMVHKSSLRAFLMTYALGFISRSVTFGIISLI